MVAKEVDSNYISIGIKGRPCGNIIVYLEIICYILESRSTSIARNILGVPAALQINLIILGRPQELSFSFRKDLPDQTFITNLPSGAHAAT